MDVSRRAVLAAIGGVTTVAAGGAAAVKTGAFEVRPDTEKHTGEPAKDAPKAVALSRPLAEAFYRHISPYFDGVRVFIQPNGEVTMLYKSTASAENELRTEFRQIAKEFAHVVGTEHEPKTLSIVVGEVQALVTEAAVRAHVNGDINEKAYLKTIEVLDIERKDG